MNLFIVNDSRNKHSESLFDVVVNRSSWHVLNLIFQYVDFVLLP